MSDQPSEPTARHVLVRAGRVTLDGDLTVPDHPTGVVVFAHGSGSGRLSPRNQRVARSLVRDGLATLVFDLLTTAEEAEDRYTAHLRFDIPMLADRLVTVIAWVRSQPRLGTLPVGLFGASTGAAAALIAATRAQDIGAVVSRGGRPDLANDALRDVEAPTLLIVGGNDPEVIELNRSALAQLRAPAKLHVVPGATHLFEEPGALDEVILLASNWFRAHLVRRSTAHHEPAAPA